MSDKLTRRVTYILLAVFALVIIFYLYWKYKEPKVVVMFADNKRVKFKWNGKVYDFIPSSLSFKDVDYPGRSQWVLKLVASNSLDLDNKRDYNFHIFRNNVLQYSISLKAGDKPIF